MSNHQPNTDDMKQNGSSACRWLRLGQWSVAVGLLLGAAPGFTAGPPPIPPLTDVSGSPRLTGKFVWVDLVTDDVMAARKFYGPLFRWTFRQAGNYLIAHNDDRPVGGMFQRERPKDQPQAKPRWFGYISVPSVERAEQAVTKAGGKVLAPPVKFPKRGEQAVFSDPAGALFGVVKSSSGDPPDFLAEPGDWIWIQLLTRDARQAAEFYRTVAGYEIVENTEPGRLSDFVLTSKGFARATVRKIPEGHEALRPSWLPFVRVQSVKDSVAQAQQLGGRVLIEPKPERLEGRVAVVADPTGAAVGLLEWSEDLMKGGK